MTTEDEREEIEFQLNAKADYLRESFGDEAALLDAQMRDEMKHEFPGDGLGTDDLADYNLNEANDYLNE